MYTPAIRTPTPAQDGCYQKSWQEDCQDPSQDKITLPHPSLDLSGTEGILTFCSLYKWIWTLANRYVSFYFHLSKYPFDLFYTSPEQFFENTS